MNTSPDSALRPSDRTRRLIRSARQSGARPSPSAGHPLPVESAQTPRFDSIGTQRRFRAAPPSVADFVAGVTEPVTYVALLLFAYALWDETPGGPAIALSLLVLVLTMPGANRFAETPRNAAIGILQSWLFVALALLLCGYVTGTLALYEPRVLLTWAVVVPLGQWAVACCGHAVVRWHARNTLAGRSAVIVGGGLAAVNAARALQERGELPTSVHGYFDDRCDKRLESAAARSRLGGLADVAGYVKHRGIDTVYIALPLGSQPRIVALLDSLQATTASLVFVPDLVGVGVIQGRLQDVNGVVMVGICETPFTGLDEAVKRCSDIVLSLLILVLVSPLMLAIAVGVKLSSPGPVLFRQRRNGLRGDTIVVSKFRTMVTLDDGAVIQQARRNDPRVTRFGAFLRRTSLDELPQFINVLQGQMSIVGPRPHAVAHNEQYSKLIKTYMLRHKVRPGITGLAQINGYRGETDTVEKMQARVELDLEYLRNWSLGLDVRIILRTIMIVLGDHKAY